MPQHGTSALGVILPGGHLEDMLENLCRESRLLLDTETNPSPGPLVLSLRYGVSSGGNWRHHSFTICYWGTIQTRDDQAGKVLLLPVKATLQSI